MNDPKRLDVASVVVDCGAGVATDAVVVVVTVDAAVTTGAAVVAGAVAAIASTFATSGFTDKSVGLAAAPPNPPNANPELVVLVAVVAATGLIAPNSVELLVVVVAAPLSTVVTLPNETPANSPLELVVAAGAVLMLPNRPVPGAIVAVEDVPKIEAAVVVVVVGFGSSRLVSAGKADLGGSVSAAPGGSSSGFSTVGFGSSFSFSLVRFRAGVVDVGTPKETGSLLVAPAPAPNEKVGLALPLLFDPKERTVGLAGSTGAIVAGSWAFGMAWMVVLVPKPYAGGGAVDSVFSLGF